MNSRKNELMKLSSVQFSAWELHIYLDTHPNDQNAIKMYNEYMSEYKTMLQEYENKYGPITASQNSIAEDWLKDPWPWDVGKECDC